MAQSVQRLTLDLTSGLDLSVVCLSPTQDVKPTLKKKKEEPDPIHLVIYFID